MSTTVLEVLLNAQINFQDAGRMGCNHNPIFLMAMDQLNNGIAAIENGKTLNYIIQENVADDVK